MKEKPPVTLHDESYATGYADGVASLTSEVETLRHALGVVLPMAKGYAAANPVGRNNQIVLWAECIALQHKAGAGE